MIALPEDSPDAFSLFVRWLYVGKIGWFTTKVDPLGQWAVSKTLVQAYILGDKMGCLIFRDVAMLNLIEHHSQITMREEEIRYVFDHSAQGSKLRRFTIDQLRYDLQEACYGPDARDFFSDARFAEDFGPIFLKRSLEANGAAAIDPSMQQERYLEVLAVPPW